jgi:hypothetical protein
MSQFRPRAISATDAAGKSTDARLTDIIREKLLCYTVHGYSSICREWRKSILTATSILMEKRLGKVNYIF